MAAEIEPTGRLATVGTGVAWDDEAGAKVPLLIFQVEGEEEPRIYAMTRALGLTLYASATAMAQQLGEIEPDAMRVVTVMDVDTLAEILREEEGGDGVG